MLEFIGGDKPEQFQYPGGEPSVKMPKFYTDAANICVLRGASSDDLIAALIWANNQHRRCRRSNLILPYLPGARADHFAETDGFDAQVYSNLLKSGRFDKIITLDPHSGVLARKIGAISVGVEEVIPDEMHGMFDGVIIPDHGAIERATKVAQLLGVPTVQAVKHRDYATGKLTGFGYENESPKGGEWLVVDDICDGGGTFAGLADVTPRAVGLSLWVTHGIFSGNAMANLQSYDNNVWTTDSHPGHNNLPGVNVVPILPALLRKV